MASTKQKIVKEKAIAVKYTGRITILKVIRTLIIRGNRKPSMIVVVCLEKKPEHLIDETIKSIIPTRI
jgi:hypothetical protein